MMIFMWFKYFLVGEHGVFRWLGMYGLDADSCLMSQDTYPCVFFCVCVAFVSTEDVNAVIG